MTSYTTPDLASILQTLSAYTPTQSPFAHGQTSRQIQDFHSLEDGEVPYEPPYQPAELPCEPHASIAPTPGFVAQNVLHQPQQPQLPIPALPPQPAQQSQCPQRDHQQPAISSASSITTWPSALRHVTHHLARNEAAMHRIKQLISTQHSHERQWWAQREALLKTQKARDEGRRKLDGVLSAVGGHIAPVKHNHDHQTEKLELQRFDTKVFMACREMVAATTAELERLDVPFFHLQKDLIVGAGENEDGKIGEDELLEQRSKMIDLLENLCEE